MLGKMAWMSYGSGIDTMQIDHQAQYCLEEAFNHLKYDADEQALQLRHRTTLVHIWAPGTRSRVLEVGCGQGETTIVLAAVVGALGQVLAVDNAPAEYGRPVTLGEAHTYIKESSALGNRIEFLPSLDLLAPQLHFPEQTFDLAVFSHSSWYLSSRRELYRLFARIRPWAKRLGYAEWDVRPQHLHQLPHLLSTVLQAQMHRIAPQLSTANIRSLILPADARLLAKDAGWTIKEEISVDTSTPLGYGKSWEIQKALEMAEQLTVSDDVILSAGVRGKLLSMRRLLRRISNETRNMSLSTYAFLAE
jgi:SAM-dependent methyltransferase